MMEFTMVMSIVGSCNYDNHDDGDDDYDDQVL